MEISVNVNITKSVEEVWAAIIDFENCKDYISSILELDVLEKPTDTLVGFKWKEKRVMFGKEATETMWITDYETNKFYQTRAENHGAIYISRLSVKKEGNGTKLTMSFSGESQSAVGKFMSKIMGFMMKGMMEKACLKDLNDIKKHLESRVAESV